LQKLKILILSYRSAPYGGGQGIYIHDISKRLSERGHLVDVLSGPPYPILSNNVNLIKLPGLDLFESFSFKDRVKKFFYKKGKSIIDYYEFFSVLFGGFPEMRTFGYRASSWIKDKKYDIVVDNQSLSYGLLKIQKIFPLIEIIHHPISKDFEFELTLSNSFTYKLSRHRWYSFLKMQKKVAPKLLKIITVSKNSKKDIQTDFKCLCKDISVIDNGIDTERFLPHKNIIRKDFRLITTASADVALKGLDFSLKAISKLRKKYPKIELIVIGKIKQDGHTQKLIENLGIIDFVHFKTGLSKEDISLQYAESSIALVTSLYEGFGYPAIEAMSCAIPLIATNVASIPDLVKEYATLIPSKNPEAICEAVEEIFKNREKFNKNSLKAREYVIERFNWTNVIDNYEQIFMKTIKEHNANI